MISEEGMIHKLFYSYLFSEWFLLSWRNNNLWMKTNLIQPIHIFCTIQIIKIWSSFSSLLMGMVLISKPFNGGNYLTWCRAMTISLNAKSKQGFIDGTTIMPSTIDKPNEYASWKKCKDMILSWILIHSHRTFQIMLFFWSRHKRYGKISGIVFLKQHSSYFSDWERYCLSCSRSDDCYSLIHET